jgi:hypothetical protein
MMKHIIYLATICVAICLTTVYGKQNALNKIDMDARAVDVENMRQTHVNAAKNSEVGVSAGPSFSAWHGELGVGEEDHFAHVRPLIEQYEKQDKMTASGETSLVEVGAKTEAKVGKVHAFCEICILIMQMKERGQPHLCAGLNPDYFISCVENLESILRADKAVVYWLRSGCMHLDRDGPEIVKPCPAHAICAWVPNLFADVGIISPRNSLAPLCPRDFKYLPRIPRKPPPSARL